MIIQALYNVAAESAKTYDGSESAYKRFMSATTAFEAASGNDNEVNSLVDMAIEVFERIHDHNDILTVLSNGGAQIFNHGAVFVPPDPSDIDSLAQGDDGEDKFKIKHEPRLKHVVMALQKMGIYYDDLVIDTGRVSDNQMRQYPYNIITIPRLNAQIAVADQYGEALFVANPSIPYMNWALFQKSMAGQEDTPFEHVQRVIFDQNWVTNLVDALQSNQQNTKVDIKEYAKTERKSKYPLTEEMIAQMAILTRNRDPNKQWPSKDSGDIDRDIIEEVTGDPDWQDESWKMLHESGQRGYRGIQKNRTLSKILHDHGCHYNLTENMITEMAILTRNRDPNKQWPGQTSGNVDRSIVEIVTGDIYWQNETWVAFQMAGSKGCRGLKKGRPLSKILRDHGCHYDLTEDMIVQMAILTRNRDANKQWPKASSGDVDRDIIEQITNDPNWQNETWRAINAAGMQGCRGLRKTRSLPKILRDHGCHYDLTETMIATMAELFRERDPEKKWPTQLSGTVDRDIIEIATGNPHWRNETWAGIDLVGRNGGRGLKKDRSLSKIMNDHCPERKNGIIAPELT